MKKIVTVALVFVCLASTASAFAFAFTFTGDAGFQRHHHQPTLLRRRQALGVPKDGRKSSTPIQQRVNKSRIQSLPIPISSGIAAVAPHVWTSLLPPCLGFYKSEYTVSLGYGFAIALTAISLLRQFGSINPLLVLHAYTLVFYGFRLNAFLVLRNIWSSRIQEFNTKVEDRAVARGNRWTTRAPFILSCGLLYYGLSIPLWFTGKLLSAGRPSAAAAATSSMMIPSWTSIMLLLKVLIGAQGIGFGVAALGDGTKTYVKRSEKDERYLVTSGIFSWIRHPNYTGEILGWTSNALAGLVAAASLWIPTTTTTTTTSTTMSSIIRPSVTIMGINLGALVIGWLGIWFVLLRATSNLEERQKADYGETTKYQEWVKSSWGGWQLPTKKKVDEESDHVTPHLELDDSVEEDFGSGI